MKKLLLMLAFMLASTVLGQEFVEENFTSGVLGYITTSANTVEVRSHIDGSDATGDLTIPASVDYDGKTYDVTVIGDRAFEDCIGLTSVEIPNKVTIIGDWSFSGCSGLTSIELPNSVTIIGDYAFSFCHGLTSVKIPNGITSIGTSAFGYCNYLASIELPNSVTIIGDYAFRNCPRLTTLLLGEGVKSLGIGSFSACSRLTTVIIPNSVNNIDAGAFSKCSLLTTVEIGDGVKNIGVNQFGGSIALTNIVVDKANQNYSSLEGVLYNKEQTSLITCPIGKTSIEIPNSVITIEDGAFYDCYSLTSVEIPNSVKTLGYESFTWCSTLETVIIGDGVESIAGLAFSGCSDLTSIVIPNSVKSIGHTVFGYCDRLASIEVSWETPLNIDPDVFEYHYGDDALDIKKIILIVPEGKLDLYQNAPVWQDFGTHNETAIEVVESPTYEVAQMLISPNPVSRTSGEVTIYFPQNILGTGTCTIYDAQGNRIDHQEVNLARGTAIRWDLCNEQGRRVATGGYLAILQITDSMGQMHFQKAMIGVSR